VEPFTDTLVDLKKKNYQEQLWQQEVTIMDQNYADEDLKVGTLELN